MYKIAILITCHNRKEETIRCLKFVCNQQLSNSFKLDVFLVDDGSTDGTSEKVSQLYPNVNILLGNGELYWNGGMRLAFYEAMRKDYDYYLWLNDDTHLFSNAVRQLLECSKANPKKIIVGSIQDPELKRLTYGGVKQVSKALPLKFVQVEPNSEKSQKCDTFNGNCVLIPRHVVKNIGNLSVSYTHGMGDFDYGLRAKKKGINSIVAPGYYGMCSKNLPQACFRKDITLVGRLKALYSPKGIPPHEWKVFAKRHAPYIWPLYMLKLYFRVLFP